MTNEYYPAVDDEEEGYTGVINTDGAHTDEYTFCIDMHCDCHEDKGEIDNVATYIADGEMTVSEADQYYRGLTI
jgi:hypothetical protein